MSAINDFMQINFNVVNGELKINIKGHLDPASAMLGLEMCKASLLKQLLGGSPVNVANEFEQRLRQRVK